MKRTLNSTPLYVALLVCLCAMGSVPSWVTAQEFDLDDQLFEDLAPLKDESTLRSSGNDSPLDRNVEKEIAPAGDFPGGVDLTKRKAASPLREVADTMQRVRDRLKERDLNAETRMMQDGIVGSFDKLIARLKQQKQQNPPGSSGKQKSPQQPQSGGGKPQPKPQGKPGGGKPGGNSKNSANSSSRQGTAQATQSDGAARDRMMQDAWGNLPAAVRQQLQSARPEKFLPGYSQLIEAYFRRLAEQEKE